MELVELMSQKKEINYSSTLGAKQTFILTLDLQIYIFKIQGLSLNS